MGSEIPDTQHPETTENQTFLFSIYKWPDCSWKPCRLLKVFEANLDARKPVPFLDGHLKNILKVDSTPFENGVIGQDSSNQFSAEHMHELLGEKWKREKMKCSSYYHGHIKVRTGYYVNFELWDNLTDSTVLNTGETGDMNVILSTAIQVKGLFPPFKYRIGPLSKLSISSSKCFSYFFKKLNLSNP